MDPHVVVWQMPIDWEVETWEAVWAESTREVER
jgi:hypothetical protein